MTSAPSRRQPSNGSSAARTFVLACLAAAAVLIVACDPKKPADQDGTADNQQDTGTEQADSNLMLTEEPDAVDTIPAEERDVFADGLYPDIRKDVYNIAFVLPFKLHRDGNSSASKLATEYYTGALMAADTLQKCGYKLNLFSFDTNHDSANLDGVKQKLTEYNIDLIVGPLYRDMITGLNEFTQENRITMISPIQRMPQLVKSNPYFISLNWGKSIAGNVAARLANSRFPDHNVRVIREGRRFDDDFTDSLKANLAMPAGDTLTDIVFGKGDDIEGLGKYFRSKSEAYVVYMPSNNEKFVRLVLNKLRTLKNERDITLIGMGSWWEFQLIEGRFWQDLNIHFLSSYFVDYDREDVKRFVLSYRNKFKQEPTEYAFRAYDAMLYVTYMMRENGKYFQRRLTNEQLPIPMLHTTFNPVRRPGTKGFGNEFMQVLRFRNYKLEPLTDY